MALKGTLKDFSLADIFQLIGLQKKTGVLTLKSGEDVVTVSFVEGSVVTADSLHRHLEDRIGTVLVKSRQMTQTQLLEALKIQKQTLKRLGNVLVDLRLVSQEALREALRVQVTQLIHRLFRWRDGDYDFSQDQRIDYDRENVVPIPAESILMEGARILDEWPMIEKRIGPLTHVYRRTPLADQALSPKPEQDAPLLGGEEKTILQAIDGVRSTQELIEGNPLSEFDTCRVLYELIGRNLAERTAALEPAAPSRTSRQRAGAAAKPATGSRIATAALLLLAALSFATARSNPLNGLSILEGSDPAAIRYLHQVSRTRLERISYAIQVFYLQNRGYPQDLNYLVVAGLLRPEDLRDPWQRAYSYSTLPWGYELQGLTAEGVAAPDLKIRSILQH